MFALKNLLSGRNETKSDTPEEIVISLYKGILQRGADPGGLQHYSERLAGGASVKQIIDDLCASEEFARLDQRAKPPGENRRLLDLAPAMELELDLPPAELDRMWAHTTEVWANYGETDPYWSVLTDPKWHAKNMDRAEKLAAFYETGEASIERLEAWLRRNQVELGADAVCAEYGCGVGRGTLWLAQRFKRVIAFDISEPHLRAAETYLAGRGVHNVEFVLMKDKSDLSRLQDFDLLFSEIVLQHNPPPIILDILGIVFSGVRKGGVCFFQLPTHAIDYAFRIEDYWQNEASKKTMETHFVPQHEILTLAEKHDVFALEIQPDGWIGQSTRWMSHTFLLRKTAA